MYNNCNYQEEFAGFVLSKCSEDAEKGVFCSCHEWCPSTRQNKFSEKGGHIFSWTKYLQYTSQHLHNFWIR